MSTMLELAGVLAQDAFPGAGVVGSSIRGHRFVPGATLRGALAAAWVRERGASPQTDPGARADFVRVFERDGRFGALRQPGDRAIPLSLRVHKYSSADCGGLVDEASQDDAEACPQCGDPLVAAKPGMATAQPGDAVPASTRVTRVSIGEAGVAEEGQLYARDGIPAGARLTGLLVGDADDFDGIDQIWLGGRRTVAGCLDDVSVTPLPDERVQGLLPDVRDVGEATEVVLYLAEPAVFVDSFGRPADRPSDADLAVALGQGATVRRAWSRLEPLGGWHVASGLPKPVEWLTVAGSVFVVTTPSRPTDEQVLRLLTSGLGLRRSEGFGMVTRSPAVVLGEAAAAAAQAADRRRADDEAWPRIQAAIATLRQHPATARGAAAACRARAAGPAGPDLLDRVSTSGTAPLEVKLAADRLRSLDSPTLLLRAAEELERAS